MMKSSKMTKFVAIVLILALLPFGSFMQVNAEVIAQKVFTDEEGKYKITVDETSAWENGYIAQITIQNTGSEKIKNWNISGDLKGTIEHIWNAQLVKQNASKTEFAYQVFNRSIAVGNQVTFGIQVKGGEFDAVDQFVLTEEKQDITESCDISYEIRDSWENSAIIDATIHNTSDKLVRDWKVAFQMNASIDNIWNGEITSQDGSWYVISNKEYNADIKANETVTFGFQVTYNDQCVGTAPADSKLYAVTDAEKVEDESGEKLDWYKTLINAEEDSVTKARENVSDTVKVALLDSGVDYSENITVTERENFLEEYEETSMWDDVAGHGTGVAGLIVSDTAQFQEEVEEEEEELEDADVDFSFLRESDVLETEDSSEEEESEEDMDEETDAEDSLEEDEYESEEDADTEYDAEDDSENEIEGDWEEEDEESEETDEEEDDFNLFEINEQYGEVEGLNSNVELYSARVLDEEASAPVSRIIEAIDWAIEKEVNIINISWGTESDSEELHNAIKKAYNKGILIIAAAGNNGTIEYPAKYDEVMAVGSVDSTGQVAENSASGEELEVVAPGENVPVYDMLGAILSASGTSYAAPQVTALAAILWQQDITKSSEFVRQLINISATPAGEKKDYGNGIINYSDAVANYDAFCDVYQENVEPKADVDALELEADIQKYNNVIHVVDDTFVHGLWGNKAHNETAKSTIVTLKNGAIWPDKTGKDGSGIAGMTSYPAFHGYHKGNYVNCYLFLMKEAKFYQKNGKWKKSSSKYYSNMKKALKRAKVGKKNRFQKTANNNTKKANAYFVYGMALHTMADVFAHSTVGTANKESHFWDDYKVYDNKVSWASIVHGPYKMVGEKKRYSDNRADNTSFKSKRYQYAKDVCKKVIKKRISANKKADSVDFTLFHPVKFTSSKKTNKRISYMTNAFGIRRFAEYVGIDNDVVSNIDYDSLVKKFSAWRSVDVVFTAKDKKTADNALANNTTCNLYQEVNNNGVIQYKAVKEAKKHDNVYTYILDVNQNYVIQCQNGEKRVTKKFKTEENKIIKDKTKKYKCYYLNNDSKSYNIKLNSQRLFGRQTISFSKEDFAKTVTLTGKITKADANKEISDNQPIKNATIELVDHKNKKIKVSGTTDESGKYQVTEISPGIYNFTICADGYHSETGCIVITSSKENKYNQPLTLVEATNTATGNATGNITDVLTGAGVAGLDLQFIKGVDNVDGVVCANTVVNSGGHYKIEDLESGYYTVKIKDNRPVDDSEKYADSTMLVRIYGGSTISEQNGVVGNMLEDSQIRIVLTWGATPRDLDSHMIGYTSDGTQQHMYYSNKTIKNSKGEIEFNLDVDDTSSYGPETTTIYCPNDEDYQFYVYNYTHNNAQELMNSGAQVTVYKGNSSTPWYTFYVPEEEGYTWNVFTYEGETGMLIPEETVE